MYVASIHKPVRESEKVQALRVRHLMWKQDNINILDALGYKEGIDYKSMNNGNILLFRMVNRPPVDFFTCTGRWRFNGYTFRGGACKFVKWYRRQIQGLQEG